MMPGRDNEPGNGPEGRSQPGAQLPLSATRSNWFRGRLRFPECGGLRGRLALFENGRIATARDRNPDGRRSPFPGEVLLQPGPEPAGVGADNIIVAGIVIG